MAVPACLLASLLPHVRDQSTENIMTLSLFHVLQEHEQLRKSFVSSVFRNVSQTPPPTVRVISQERTICGCDLDGSPLGQPDILFLDDKNAGDVVLILENKVSARLTERQPVDYIRLLAKNRPAGMVLIAPTIQIEYYRAQCLKLCKEAFPELVVDEKGHFCIGQKFVNFLSWKELIRSLDDEAAKNQDTRSMCDLSQLEGIRVQIEMEEVNPFSIEDFAGLKQVAGRIPQLYRLVEKLRRRLKGPYSAAWEPSLWNNIDREDGVILLIHGKKFWLVPDFKLLAKESSQDEQSLSLFWLRIGFNWEKKMITTQDVQTDIRRAMEESSERVLDEPAGHFSMALPFKAEQSEESIVATLAGRIDEFASNLGKRAISPVARLPTD